MHLQAINPIGLGIDAGGTSTRWALASADGSIITEGQVAGLSALQMNSEDGREALRSTLAQLAHDVRAAGEPAYVCAGMTGFDQGSEAGYGIVSLIAGVIGVSRDAIRLGNDVEIAYLDIFAPGAGYVVYAGTGSIAAFIDENGEMHRAGGRGNLLDDGGGGYWIAREALRQIWRAEDERPDSWRDSPMAVEMFARIGGSDWAASRDFVYGGSSRGDIGRLAIAVAAAAQTDPAALAILQAAGAELARLARAMTGRFGARPIALAGRAIELHPAIEQSCRAHLPVDADLKLVVSQAHYAAARIAAKSNGQKHNAI